MNAPLAAERLIVALDVDTHNQALSIVEQLGASVSFYKVGWRVFIREGYTLVDTLIAQDKKVFLDLKMDDISATIETALANFPRRGIELLTLQGGSATVRAAKRGRGSRTTPKLLSVTFLSSLDAKDLQELLGENDVDLDQHILRRADRALEAGADGLIASGDSVRTIRQALPGDYLIVTPGIRPSASPAGDQKRTLTPSGAIRAGADYLVVGRPITQAEDPARVAVSIIAEMQQAFEEQA